MNSSISGLKLVQPLSIVPPKLLHWMGIISILGAIGAVVVSTVVRFVGQTMTKVFSPP
jgi:hypothetical protein